MKKIITMLCLITIVLSMTVFAFTGCTNDVFKDVDVKTAEVLDELDKIINSGELFEAEYTEESTYVTKLVFNEDAYLVNQYYEYQSQIITKENDNVTIYFKEFADKYNDKGWTYNKFRNDINKYNDLRNMYLDVLSDAVSAAKSLRWRYDKEKDLLYSGANEYIIVGKDKILFSLGDGNLYNIYNIGHPSKIEVPTNAKQATSTVVE